MSSSPEASAPLAAADQANPPAQAAEAGPVVFETQVQPILQRCAPCHFEGGQMYDRLPFDDPETIRELGVALFTRIRDENEQAVIRAFLSQAPPPSIR